MKSNDDLHRILLKGGVTSPGELKDSIAMLEAAGQTEVFLALAKTCCFRWLMQTKPS